MAFILKALCMLLVAATCIQLCNAQFRCQCPNTSSKPYQWKTIQSFSIALPQGRCKETEIILTLTAINSETGEHEKRCISPTIKQAKILELCWRKNNATLETIPISKC